MLAYSSDNNYSFLLSKNDNITAASEHWVS